MIYKEVSKVHKGVIRTLWLIAALSLVLSYAVMCIAWLSKGCHYGAQFCINVFMRALPLCLIFLCIVELAGLFIWVFKIKKLEMAAVTNILSFLKNIFSGRTKIRVTGF